MTDAVDSQPADRCRAGPTPTASTDTGMRRRPVRAGDESYSALVWRRFRRSVTGMVGLSLVVAAALSCRSSPTSSRRWTRRRRRRRLRAARQRSASTTPDGSFHLPAGLLPIVETGELDPVTFQPLTGPDIEQPGRSRLLRQGLPLQALLAHPHRPPLSSARRRHAAALPRHRQARPRHPLARHHRLAHLADHRAGRRRAHHHHRHPARHHLGLYRRPVRRLVPALRRDRPRLPAAAALPGADHADPGHRALQRLPRLRHRSSSSALGWAQLSPRGARQDHGAGAHRICARRDGGRRRRRAHHHPPHPAQRASATSSSRSPSASRRSCCWKASSASSASR